jgi:hypothetical protein
MALGGRLMNAEGSGSGVRHPSVRARRATERLIRAAVIGALYLVVGVVIVAVR